MAGSALETGKLPENEQEQPASQADLPDDTNETARKRLGEHDQETIDKWQEEYEQEMAQRDQEEARREIYELELVDSWTKEYEKQIAGSTDDSDDQTPVVCKAGDTGQPPEIENTLEKIRDSGKTFRYILKTWAKTHSGDLEVGKGLLLSVGCQCITNSKGIHISLTGESGYGKSDAAKKMIKLLPDEYTFDASLSPNFLYDAQLEPGTTVLIDDMAWGSDLGSTIKRVSTDYQTGSTRGTKKDMESVKQKTPARLTFWITSVDSHADEQIRDRFLMKELESSPERREQIKNFIAKEAKGDLVFPSVSEDDINMCKELIRDMRKHEFEVVIPFADRIEITGDTRALAIFLDMVKSHAVFHYAVRATDEKGRLMAIEEDFWAAKEVFEDFGGHSADKFNETETRVLQAIIACGGRATTGEILEKTGITSGRLTQIMNGRKDRGEENGLLHKCKGLCKKEDEKTYENIYTLPEGFKLDGQVEQVTLIPENVTTGRVTTQTSSYSASA